MKKKTNRLMSISEVVKELKHIPEYDTYSKVIRRVRRGQLPAEQISGWSWIIKASDVEKIKNEYKSN